MNRKGRRAAMAMARDKLASQIMQWPMLPPGELPPNRTSHMVIQHDDWCKKLNGQGECNCEPLVSIHLQPIDLR